MKMYQSHLVVLIAGLFALQVAALCAVLRRSSGIEQSGLTSWMLGDLAAAAAALLLGVDEARPAWLAAGAVDMALVAALSMMAVGMRHFTGRPGRAVSFLVLNLLLGGALALDALAPGFAPFPLQGDWLSVALGVGHVGLLLDLTRSMLAGLPGKRGMGRLAAWCLIMVAVAAVGVDGWHFVQGVSGSLPDGTGDALAIVNIFVLAGLLLAYDRMRRLLVRKASHDDLTNVLSRGAYWEALEAACGQADRERKPLTVAFVDLDHFKAINDVYGHQAGDSVLRHFAGLLRKTAGRADILGRLGGEEFAIAMPDTPLEKGRVASMRLTSAVRSTPCPSEPDAISYTISIGMAQREPGESVESLMRRADHALYDAKRKGRNGVSLYLASAEQDGSVKDRSLYFRQRAVS